MAKQVMAPLRLGDTTFTFTTNETLDKEEIIITVETSTNFGLRCSDERIYHRQYAHFIYNNLIRDGYQIIY